MRSRILLALITVAFVTNASYSYGDIDQERKFYTGESFFSAPSYIEKGENADNSSYDYDSSNDEAKNGKKTVPPIKKLRTSIQQKKAERQAKKSQFAPTEPNASIYNSDKETSEFASKEGKEEFDENMMPDGFDADEQAIEETKNAKHFWSKNKTQVSANNESTENIVLDCDNMDYDTENYCLYATGNVNVEFVKQETTVKADKITYDRMNNTIKAEGNVHIIKNGQVIDGDYIFVDMNEENALIENPVTKTATIEIKAKKGYVYGDKIVQEQGSIDIEDSYPLRIKPSGGAPRLLDTMIIPKDQTLQSDLEKRAVRVKAKELIITQKGDLETLAIKRANVKKDKYTILKIPAIKIYTNKNHDYAETNIWEMGSYRDLGAYIGPGFVFELPKGSVLKAIPMLNYDHRIGVGVLGRFNSGTNFTTAAYGTAKSKIILRGYQKLDDYLFLQYAMNDYVDDWWLGKRRPKYGLDLAYRRAYVSNNFLLKNHTSKYEHMFDVGYFQDIQHDKHFSALKGSGIGTMRMRYMAQATQNLYNYRNVDKQTALSLDIASEFGASLYGTGDTQVIGRIGPRMHTQWRRWMQDIGYYQSVYDDNSPVSVYDAYRYGKSNVYLREYFRICKYLTLSWYGSINLSGDSPSDDRFQENSFWLSLGPDDFKFNVGYDIIRQNTFFGFEMKTDAKGAHVDYDKMVIKRDKKPSEEIRESNSQTQTKSTFKNSEKAPVLEYAQVENIKNEEEVL